MTSTEPGATKAPLAKAYAAKVAAGEISADAAQLRLVARLDTLLAELSAPARRGILSRWRPSPSPRGIYIYGAVGRGKTMLMDLFFAAALGLKRRIHFHEFMGEIQDRLHVARQYGGDDPIAPVAVAIAAEARVLCLDEFSVTDIADAMILARLFEALFAKGVVLVATSNSAPRELYKDGLNRGLFLPFIDLLEQRTDVVHLDIETDYRLAKIGGAKVYVTPLNEASRTALDALWLRLTGVAKGSPTALRTRGRDIRVPQAVDGVARFSFADLCEAPLAANDYLQIARAFHTIVVDGIRIVGDEQRDVARRFILLIDTLYDHRVNLIASAAAEPALLYTARDGDEAFAFQRTVSRLIEMRSAAYLGAAHGASVSDRPAPQS